MVAIKDYVPYVIKDFVEDRHSLNGVEHVLFDNI
jgi:hypothetical protein